MLYVEEYAEIKDVAVVENKGSDGEKHGFEGGTQGFGWWKE